MSTVQANEKEEDIKRLEQRIKNNQTDIERLIAEIEERESERDKVRMQFSSSTPIDQLAFTIGEWRSFA